MKNLAVIIKIVLVSLVLCILGCGKSVEQPLTHEVNNPLVDGGRWSALHEAVQKGNAIRVQELLSKGIIVNIHSAKKSDFGVTPLYLACEKGDLGIVQILLDKGANVNMGKNTDATPLHVAVETGNRPLVEILILRGANIDSDSFFVHKPIEIAHEMGRKDIEELLVAALKNKGGAVKP